MERIKFPSHLGNSPSQEPSPNGSGPKPQHSPGSMLGIGAHPEVSVSPFEQYRQALKNDCPWLSEETIRIEYELDRQGVEQYPTEVVKQGWLEFYLWVKAPSDPEDEARAAEDRQRVSHKYPQLWKRLQTTDREEFTEWFMKAD